MPTTPIVPILYSVVKSVATTTLPFSFLGAHGVTLAPGAQYAFPGNILEQMLQDPTQLRKFHAFERALVGYTDDQGLAHAPTLVLLSLPSLVLLDSVTKQVKVLGLANGTLTLTDPSWGAEESALSASFSAITSGTTPVASATLTFSQPVNGFDVTDVHVTLNGTPVVLTGVTVTSSDHKVWTVNGLAANDTTNGTYVIKVPYVGTGITDVDGNTLTADVTATWTKS